MFTPSALVKKKYDSLPPCLFTDPSKTFIDPACGSGNLLVEVLKRKIESGSTPLQALQTVYGVDIMEDNIEECRIRLFKIAVELNSGKWERSWKKPLLNNIVCANALEVDLETLFD